MAPLQMVRFRRLKRCFLWICRTAGCLVLAAAGLAAASPVVLVLLFLLGLLLSSVLLGIGVLAGLAAIAACILHYLVGLPFWFWMILTGFGALVFVVGVLGSILSGDHNWPDRVGGTSQSCDTFVLWPWLLAGLQIGRWWVEHNEG
ncbi:MAG: hypothetical protein ACUVSK_13635 [Desulfotomaculales bacterium]